MPPTNTKVQWTRLCIVTHSRLQMMIVVTHGRKLSKEFALTLLLIKPRLHGHFHGVSKHTQTD